MSLHAFKKTLHDWLADNHFYDLEEYLSCNIVNIGPSIDKTQLQQMCNPCVFILLDLFFIYRILE